jgi:hypothetical protein
LIGRIRRVFRGPQDEELSWNPDEPFEDTLEADAGPATEVVFEPSPLGGVFAPSSTNEVERQAELVRAAMAQGGKCGDHEIPIPWLRMTLAGLEGRAIDVDAMWEGVASPVCMDPVEESPAYQSLFPTPG